MKLFLITALLWVGALAEDFVLPEDVMTCEQDSPELNTCIKNAIQDMIPKLHHGNDALKIPPIDPYEIADRRYNYNQGTIQGYIQLKQVKTYGLSRTQIKDVRTEFSDKGLKSEFDVYFPRLFIEGNFKANIKLNNLKMTPKGYFNITMSDVSATQKLESVFEIRNGIRYSRAISFDVEPEVGDMKIYATNLLPTPELNEMALNFINQYWPVLYRLMLPETRNTWEPLLLDAMNEFLSHVPFDKLITKSKQ